MGVGLGLKIGKMAMGGKFKSLLANVMRQGFYPDPAQKVSQQLLGRLAPDAIFGGMAAMQTPGDIGDKLIAGGTQFIGGGLGGGLVTGVTGGRLGTFGELAGGFGGDFAGMAIGDTLQRGKDKIMGGEGRTAYERMSDKQQQEFADQIRQQTLAGAGLIPGVQNQYLNDLGL